MTATAATTELYGVITAGPTARERLQAVLDACTMASILIRPLPGARLGGGEVKPLVEMIQKRGVAAIVEDDAQLARTVRADGVHLTCREGILEAYAEARRTLGDRFIVGADAGQSRHLAMSLGEAGVDYVGFGLLEPGAETARQTRDDLAGWWSEIFEIPCVVFGVTTPDEAAALAQTGADFVAVTIPPGLAPAAARDMMTDIESALGHVAP